MMSLLGPRRNGRTKLHILPNLITTGSLLCGLLAIFYTFEKTATGTGEESLKLACWFILLSAVLDALDGKIARMTGTESDFGVYYDSLSDAIVFGVAPAMLMYSYLRLGENVHLAEFSCISFVICGALRLARFNVQSGSEEHTGFTGLPIPGAAAMVVSCYLVATTKDLKWTLPYTPYIMMGLALLMVSRIPFSSLKGFDFDSSRSFEILVGVVIFAASLVALRSHLEWVVLALVTTYVLSGPVSMLLRKSFGRESTAVASKSALADEGGDADNDKVRHIGNAS